MLQGIIQGGPEVPRGEEVLLEFLENLLGIVGEIEGLIFRVSTNDYFFNEFFNCD